MYLKRRTSWAVNIISLVLFLMVFSMAVAPVSVNAGVGDLTVDLTSPAAELDSSGDTQIIYQVKDPVDYDNLSFIWNFSNGINTYLQANKEAVTLKATGGDDIVINYDQELLYTEQTEPVKLRQLELTMVDSGKLQPDMEYIVELGPDIMSNNGSTLGKTLVWHFTTASSDGEGEKPGDSAPVAWPAGNQLTSSNITASSLTLNWTGAENATQYKIYQDSNEIKTLNGSELSCNITGLAAKTAYAFKVEAGDASEVWTNDGPAASVTTAGQLTIASYSPASNQAADASKIDYQVSSLLDPAGIRFVWDFSNGMDEKLVSNLEKIALKKNDGTVVALDRGTLTQEEITGDIIELGDFKYTKQSSPTKLRRLEFILSSSTLEYDTSYKLKLASDIEANNGDKLWLNHVWTFTTGTLTPPTDEGGGLNDGSESGSGTVSSGGMTVDFNAHKLNPEQTILYLDFSKGIDENLSSNLSHLEILGKNSGKSVSFSDYEYVKEEKTETGDKVRRLVLYLDDLKPSTAYIVKLGQDFTANNGSTLGKIYQFEFTTRAMAASNTEGTHKPDPTIIEPIILVTEEIASPAVIPLNDINGHWAQENIQALLNRAVVSGYPDGSFKPQQTITRAEFVTMLVKAFALEARDGTIFADSSNHWARQDISSAAGYAIVSGYNSSTFGPDDLITREQIAVMLMKAASLTDAAEGNSFNDSSKISSWAMNAVNICFANDIILGYEDNTFRPQNNASRAEAVMMISRTLK